MSFGLEIVDLLAVLGTTCLMVALAVMWYAPSVFGKCLPYSLGGDSKSNMSAYVRVAVSCGALFVSLYVIAYAVALAPLMDVHSYQVGIGLLLLVAGLRGSEAIRLRHSPRYFLTDFGYYALVIIGGALLFTYWPS